MLRPRYRKIIFYYARVVLSLLIWDVLLFKLGFKRVVRKGRSRRLRKIAQRYTELAIEMGGVLIKVGQFLSARVDMLPIEVTDELSGLQDKVPPEQFRHIRQLAETELGAALEEKFVHFEEEPLASASLGQVHRAILNPEDIIPKGDGDQMREVVVKVQRPNIEKLIATDLAAMRTVTQWLMLYPPIRRRADLPALMNEFSNILTEEIDYIAEGQNAETFGDIYKHDPIIKIPLVIWSHTTKRVLTLEDVYAIKITDYSSITEVGVNRSDVAQRLFETYLDQIFKHRFFHADPHPGNLFVIPLLEEKHEDIAFAEGPQWQLAFVDFGMVGRVPENALDGLREGVIAVGTQDAGRLVRSYQKLGFLLPEADLGALEQVEAKAFERFWGMTMAELRDIDHRELMEFAHEFRDLMFTMPFQIPQDLILLGRTFAILSGMCIGLDPAFNIWESIRPYAEEMIKTEVTGNWELWWGEVELLLRSLFSMPRRMDLVLGQIERGEIHVQVPELQSHLKGIEKGLRGLTAAILFAVLFISGMQLILAGYILPGSILLGSALIPLVVMFIRPDR